MTGYSSEVPRDHHRLRAPEAREKSEQGNELQLNRRLLAVTLKGSLSEPFERAVESIHAQEIGVGDASPDS